MSTDPPAREIRADDAHAAEHFAKGFPWCDTCRAPAIYNEPFGMRHATAQHPNGVPQRLDNSGHDATIRGWWNDERR
ncbi:hypothetical protein K1T35_48270 (plasmid) [Pseudonocardia sp. DSM 110487]|uniref:hypothetical protein n=1 Tax=Pseudonocardia sp. DSM 110487 TaxID=2865833 RepID=UPI001C6951FA|nr:hypothetical protein [Pseudonocardia sp. DSM 110487]QYN41145.1 hypothetical protein K1T35_48270 [Pseudonocardia sp. DSM 110487]